MIVLFEENEQEFTSLGLGILKDALSCKVSEKLNDEFTVEMEYPIAGANYDKIKIGRIIFCKPNPYDNMQAFRIYSITDAIGGIVTVSAAHISYDMNDIPVKAFSATSLQDAILQIQNGSVVKNDFVISSDILSSRTYKTTAPYNLRALLMGEDDSLLNKYDAEVKFNNYYVSILQRRGKNRGAVVRYGHNMTDLTHEVSNDNLYNGVFPYYHTEKETTETTSGGEFTKVYIVGSKPFQENWFSYTKNGETFHPVAGVPVQVDTDGEYKDKVYVWDDTYNLYREKIYNEMVNLIQGVLEPSWITIDWKSFPTIKCVAAKKGYFKMATDTDWGTVRGVGDVIFEGSIVDSGIAQNMVLYYSEVIPSKSDSSNTDATEIVDVQLDDPIIWIDTPDARKLKHNRVLMLDLTSEFDEEPTKERLKAKAEEYISKNKIGQLKHTTTLSFIDLSSTGDKSKVENTDHVEIGDTVKVIYEDAGISTELRVITTTYDALGDKYESVELGEKEDTMTSNSVQTGDGISALTNDVGYASVTTVNKLIADIVNANYIEALNAKLSKAQIAQLEVEQINVKGIIQASQFEIDSLVAKLLVADNAKITDTLEAGKIKVAGDISINSGKITIRGANGTMFLVDRDGNVTANSVSITGGNLNINDGRFEVTNDGVLTAQAAYISGTIDALNGSIGGFTIAENQLYSGTPGSAGSVLISAGNNDKELDIAGSSPKKNWAFTAGKNFGVDINGNLYAKSAFLEGILNAKGGYIANFKIENDRIGTFTNDKTYNYNSTGDGIYLGEQGLKLGDGFKVGTDGNLTLTKGSILIKDDTNKTSFEVNANGSVTANSVTITGGSFKIGEDNRFSVDTNGFLSAINAHISGATYSDGAIILGGSPNFERIHFQNESATVGSAIVGVSRLYTEKYIANKYYYSPKDTSGIYLFDKGPSFDPNKEYYEYKNGAAFYVSPEGEVRVNNDQFTISPEGEVTAQNAHIKGEITADSGKIGGWEINRFLANPDDWTAENGLFYGKPGTASSMVLAPGTTNTYTIPNLINSAKKWFILGSNKFGVDVDGNLYAINATLSGSMNITSGSINLGNGAFTVDSDGEVIIKKGGITLGSNFSVDKYGTIKAYRGYIGSLYVDKDYLSFGTSSNNTLFKIITRDTTAWVDPFKRDTQLTVSSIYSDYYKMGTQVEGANGNLSDKYWIDISGLGSVYPDTQPGLKIRWSSYDTHDTYMYISTKALENLPVLYYFGNGKKDMLYPGYYDGDGVGHFQIMILNYTSSGGTYAWDLRTYNGDQANFTVSRILTAFCYDKYTNNWFMNCTISNNTTINLKDMTSGNTYTVWALAWVKAKNQNP
nr:MAG TPA: tail protein [Caudoviricetes sp.]